MTTLEILRAARALIDAPEKWWGGEGRMDGVRMCAWQSFSFAHESGCGKESRCAETVLARAMGVEYIPEFNDSHTHAEVLAAFDRAIANEEAREQEFTGDLVIDEAPEPAVV